jgi:ribosomal protein S18 acetylase RimI-like enzyme
VGSTRKPGYRWLARTAACRRRGCRRGGPGTYLGRITVHPDHQGRGIGTHVLGQVIAQATAHGEPVLLDVLLVNHRAQQLYRRLGFYEQYRHGENNIKIRMRRDPT